MVGFWNWLNARGHVWVVLLDNKEDGLEPVAVFLRKKSADDYAEEWNSFQRETGGRFFEKVVGAPFWWFAS